MSKIVIRAAKPSDVVNIYRLLSKSDEFPGMRLGQAIEPMTIQIVLNLINSGYVAVADLSGHVVGSIGLTAFPLPWSGEPVLYSTWLAAQPHHYSSGVIPALLRSVIKHADKVNIKVHLQLSNKVLENLDDESIAKLGIQDRGKVFTFEKAVESESLDEEDEQEEPELGAGAEPESAD